MRLLDTYCGAGGATRGYQRAGFYVVGVDIAPQPHYVGDEFHQGDAIEYIRKHGHEFDVIHASPPCQRFSAITRTAGTQKEHPDLIEETRRALQAAGRPYVIENVEGAPLLNPLLLCGTMFGLGTIRHRLFECWPTIWFPPAPCCHDRPVVRCGRRPDLDLQFHSIAGHFSGIAEAQEAMGIDWMTQAELSQAIPPAYTEWLGRRIVEVVTCAA